MLTYAGYTVELTQSIISDGHKLPSVIKCAYNVILDVANDIICKSITPVNVYTDCAISDLIIDDLITIRIDSNVDFSYWIVAKVVKINQHNINDEQIHIDYTHALIANNIKQLLVPTRGATINLMPGYNYVIWRVINPWIKMYPMITIKHDEITINYATYNDWCIIIYNADTYEYQVAVRLGADNYRNMRHHADAIDDFVDLYRC